MIFEYWRSGSCNRMPAFKHEDLSSNPSTVKKKNHTYTEKTVYTGLKYEGKTPLDYQHTVLKNEGQDGKISLFQG
jgi:hypothetical protein